MQFSLERTYRRLGPRYLRASLWSCFRMGSLVGLLGYGIMALYIHMSVAQFFLLLAVEMRSAPRRAARSRYGLREVEPAAVGCMATRGGRQRLGLAGAAGLPLRLLRHPPLYVSARSCPAGRLNSAGSWTAGLRGADPLRRCFLTYLYWVVVPVPVTERLFDRPGADRCGAARRGRPPGSEPATTRDGDRHPPALVVMTGAVVPGISFGAGPGPGGWESASWPPRWSP